MFFIFLGILFKEYYGLVLEAFEDFLCALLFFGVNCLKVLTFVEKIFLEEVIIFFMLFFDSSNVVCVKSLHLINDGVGYFGIFFSGISKSVRDDRELVEGFSSGGNLK